MNILGIESSGLTASAAVMTDGRLVSEYTVNNKKTHSQTLLPMISEVMSSAGLETKELDCIAISRGPGSFTGLRIGSATAKGLGLALDKKVAEVSTLEVLAYNLIEAKDCILCPIMDARRQEVYTAAYEAGESDPVNASLGNESEEATGNRPLRIVIPEKACPLDELLRELEGLNKKVLFNGDGVPVYSEYIKENFKGEYAFASNTLLLQRAASVAALGTIMYEAGEIIDADAHVPVYLRKSQAERELAAKG